MTTEVATTPIRYRIGRDGDVTLRNIAGNVRLTGTDSDEVEIIARPPDGDDPPALNVKRYEGGISVEPETKGPSIFGLNLSRSPEIDFEVELPHNARLELSVISATIDGRGLHGDQKYKLVSGDLRLQSAGGRVDAKSVSGRVTVSAELPIELNAATTSGDIDLDANDVQLARLKSISGSAGISGRLAAGPEHRVETVSGHLRLESAAGVTIEASGPIVDVHSALPGIANTRRGRRSFVVGDGAARLRFRSMSGEVNVEGPADQAAATDQLDILRALERGEIDVDEASRRLAGEA